MKTAKKSESSNKSAEKVDILQPAELEDSMRIPSIIVEDAEQVDQ